MGRCSETHAHLRRNLITNLIRPLTVLLLPTLTSRLFIAETQDPYSGGFSPSFSVGGRVSYSATYDLQELQNLSPTRVHDVYIYGRALAKAYLLVSCCGT